MSSENPPIFTTSIFNTSAFLDEDQTLTLENADKRYLTKSNPSVIGTLTAPSLAVSSSINGINANASFKTLKINPILNTFGDISILGDKSSQTFPSSNCVFYSESSFQTNPVAFELALAFNANSSTNPARMGTTSDSDLVFVTNASERLRISNSGDLTAKNRIMIGTSTDNASSRLISALDSSLSTGNSKYICFGRDSTNNGNQAELNFHYAGNSSLQNRLGFGFLGVGEKMCIEYSGSVGIGLTNPAYLLELSSDSAAKPLTSTWTTTSDKRVKEDIEDADLDICYENIKKMKLRYFKWKDSFIEEHSVDDRHKLGFIAQEIEPFFPKAVTSIKKYGFDDFKGLNNDNLYNTLFGAVQRLIADVENLKKKLD